MATDMAVGVHDISDLKRSNQIERVTYAVVSLITLCIVSGMLGESLAPSFCLFETLLCSQ